MKEETQSLSSIDSSFDNIEACRAAWFALGNKEHIKQEKSVWVSIETLHIEISHLFLHWSILAFS